jgi:dihydrofolate synthase/folylpolyglutamate synthase
MPGLSQPSLQDFLSSLPDLGARRQDSISSADFTLEHLHTLMIALDEPQHRYPSIHIAGTNGKGSVAAFCASALQAQGYKVGSFTSPHIHSALDGISINGEVGAQNELAQTFELIRPHLDPSLVWTYFEIVTALAFTHFARVGVDAAVIEVGLGGRLDATNVVTPLVSVITPIDFDHTSILGNTLAAIATEKAGIIKPAVPVVISPQDPEARAAILNIAAAKQAPVTEIGADILFSRYAVDLIGQQVRIWHKETPEQATIFHIGLHGVHQVANAATAFAAMRLADKRGLQINSDSIEKGFAAARWPGRFEIMQADPPFVLDAAHSPAAARVLQAALDDYFPKRPIVAVLGVSIDKDLAGLLKPLRPRLAQLVATQSSHPRAMPASELTSKLTALGFIAQSEPEPAKAVSSARSLAASDSVLLCFGSVFLIEQILENSS